MKNLRHDSSSNYLSGNACHLRICTGFPEGFGGLRAGDYATALQEWRPLAEQGHADAQYNLGIMYEMAKAFHKTMQKP